MKIHPVLRLAVKLKMTKRALAEALGVDESTLWRWQKDKKSIPVQHHRTLARLAKRESVNITGPDLYV